MAALPGGIREDDEGGVEVLTVAECLRLLGTGSRGRLAVQVGALPVVVPVAFGLDESGLLVELSGDERIERATRDAVVAFETDRIDPSDGSGWSVIVTGTTSEAGDDGGPTVGAGAGRRWIRVSLDLVSGRRVARNAARR